jgi:hypothetical protein
MHEIKNKAEAQFRLGKLELFGPTAEGHDRTSPTTIES